MKIFNINWLKFFERLKTWNTVSPQSRKAYCARRSNDTIPASQLKDDLSTLIEKQFVTSPNVHNQVRFHPESREFARALRGMHRHRLAQSPGTGTLQGYLKDNFTAGERTRLCLESADRYVNEHTLFRHVSTATWVTDFLSGNDRMGWEWRAIDAAHEGGPLFPDKRTFEATKELIRRLVEAGDWVRLTDLPNLMSAMPREVLSHAISAAVRLVLVFPTLHARTYDPLIGVWPDILKRLNRPKAQCPAPVVPKEVFHVPFLIEDMTAILVATAGEPLQLKTNATFYAKAERALNERLLPLPDWVEEMRQPSVITAQRIETARRYLNALKLIRQSGKPGQDFCLVLSGRADEWLAASPKRQLQWLLAHLKKPPRSNAADDYDFDECWGPHGSVSLLPSIPYDLQSIRQDVWTFLCRAWDDLPEKEFLPIEGFCRWQVETKNPLLKPGVRERIRSYSWAPVTEDSLERRWSELLTAWLVTRLVPLGGLRLAIGNAGQLAIASSSIGRAIVGRAEDFEYAPPQAPTDAIVIQPNFDVTFLAAAPLAEAKIARLAKRQGHGVGLLFRITRESIFEAAATGMTSEDVLETLRVASSQPLPKNVEREIKGWFAQCRHVSMRTAVLLHCPDRETAARVASLAGRKGELLTETVVELQDGKAAKTLQKKLRQMGVFMGKER